MIFGLDYLSAHLDAKMYDFNQFEREAASQVFNQETGDIFNSKIPRSNYRADVHYNDVVIGSHNGSQYNFAEIVKREGLKVTRVDLCCDVSGRELFSEECTPKEALILLKRKITNFFLKEGRRVQSNDYGVVSKDKNSPIGCTFGARGSEYQIRIYCKSQDNGTLVRVEFQLRKELARNVWQEISDNPYNQNLLAAAFFSVEDTVLAKGLLGLDYKAELFQIRSKTVETQADREVWIRTQVLSACLKEFKETGKNLPELLLADFNKHFATLAANNIEYNQLSERSAKAERLFSE